jgi:hypothetical protein
MPGAVSTLLAWLATTACTEAADHKLLNRAG